MNQQTHTVTDAPKDPGAILEEYARLNFNETYGIEYEGASTKPKDLMPSGELFATSDEIIINNDQWDEIEVIIDSHIISHLGVPKWLKDTLKADLKKEFLLIKRNAEQNAIKSVGYSTTYPDPLVRPSIWKSLATLAFTSVVSSDGGNRTYIQFLGVFYPMKREALAMSETREMRNQADKTMQRKLRI